MDVGLHSAAQSIDRSAPLLSAAHGAQRTGAAQPVARSSDSSTRRSASTRRDGRSAGEAGRRDDGPRRPARRPPGRATSVQPAGDAHARTAPAAERPVVAHGERVDGERRPRVEHRAQRAGDEVRAQVGLRAGARAPCARWRTICAVGARASGSAPARGRSPARQAVDALVEDEAGATGSARSHTPKPCAPRTARQRRSPRRRRCRSKRICMRVAPARRGHRADERRDPLDRQRARRAGLQRSAQRRRAGGGGGAGVCATATPAPRGDHATTSDPIHFARSMRLL